MCSTLKKTCLIDTFIGKVHCEKYWANHPKQCGNCDFPQNFHTRKLGENYGIFPNGSYTFRTIFLSSTCKQLWWIYYWFTTSIRYGLFKFLFLFYSAISFPQIKSLLLTFFPVLESLIYVLKIHFQKELMTKSET